MDNGVQGDASGSILLKKSIIGGHAEPASPALRIERQKMGFEGCMILWQQLPVGNPVKTGLGHRFHSFGWSCEALSRILVALQYTPLWVFSWQVLCR